MTHKEYKDRLIDILDKFTMYRLRESGLELTSGLDELTQSQTIEAVTQLFQDFKDTVIGEEETQLWDDEWSACTKCDYQPEGSKECLCVINNKLRQTQD